MYEFTNVAKSIPGISILATCKLIHTEACRILTNLVQKIQNAPPKMLVEARSLNEILRNDTLPVVLLERYYEGLKHDPYMSHEQFLSLEERKSQEEIANGHSRGYCLNVRQRKSSADTWTRYIPMEIKTIDVGITNTTGYPQDQLRHDLLYYYCAYLFYRMCKNPLLQVRDVVHLFPNAEEEVWQNLGPWIAARATEMDTDLNRALMRGSSVSMKEWRESWEVSMRL